MILILFTSIYILHNGDALCKNHIFVVVWVI